jgi:DNA-binding NarL/FixJ family response regulator
MTTAPSHVSATWPESAVRIRSNAELGHRVKVVVIEEHEIVRRGLVDSLAEDDSIEVTTATDHGGIAGDVDIAVVSARAARRDGFPCAQPTLESRSRLVLEMMADGNTTREIATRMNYSERTIKKLITVVQAQLQTRSRAQTVAEAIRRGLI